MNMRWIDRALLAVLALGVWVLVMKPVPITADDDHRHRCSADGTGWGEIDGSEVFVYTLDIDVRCKHR